MKIVFSQKVFSILAILTLLLGLFSIELIEGWYYIGIFYIIILYLLNLFFVEEKRELKYIAIIFAILFSLSILPSIVHEKPIGISYVENGGTMSNPIESEGYQTNYQYKFYFNKREINIWGLVYTFYLTFVMFGFYKEFIVIERRKEEE